MSITPLTLNYEGISLRGDTNGEESNTLVLHGAGQSSRLRFKSLRDALLVEGIVSTAFDLEGHGETGGQLIGSSLKSRTKQASSIVERYVQLPANLIAASMGSYTAIKLTQFYSIENLVLLVPGVYTRKAYEIPFGPDFSQAIRKEKSWLDSDAFEILAQYTGNLLIIAAEFDEVIPIHLIEKLYESSERAKLRTVHMVKGAKHKEIFKKHDDLNAISRLIVQMVSES